MSTIDELKARLKAEMARTPAPTRRDLKNRTVIGLGAGLAIALALVLLRGGANPGGRPTLFMGAVTLVLVMFAARNLLAALQAELWSRPANARRLVVMPYLALAAIAIAYARVPSTPHPLQNDLPCAITTLLLAGVVGVTLVVARRGTEPVRPALKGFLLSSFSAAVAAALVFLACPLEDVRHFALAHLGGALIAGALLAGLASRVVRV